MDVTAEERNDSVVCRTDGGGMSQDVFPIQIRVTVFILTRLCANAEIGVHRGRIASLRHSCSSLRHSCSSLRHSCSSLRHSCSSLPSFLLLPPVIPAPLSVIPAKAGILIRMWTSRATHHPDPHQKLQDIQTTNNPYFKRLSRVVDGNSMTLINNISR